MKTNKNMIRVMGGFAVIQRTKDGMFNATELLKQWNLANPKKKKEKVQLFFNNDKVKQFIEVLGDDLNGQEVTHLTTRGKNGGTWMHPYLFIKFAMWINPRYELDVIKFVYDQLIMYRHNAGDNYKELAAAAVKFKDTDFRMIGKGLNYIVFNKHQKDLRQTATEQQLKDLNDIQKNLAFAINMGLIKSFKQLVNKMRELYNNRHNPIKVGA